MASPADRQAEANAEVERIAAALYDEIRRPLEWAYAPVALREKWIGHARFLLLNGDIRPPKREPVDPPMTGQTTIEEQLSE